MAKKIRSLLTEIDKKFKESEEVSASNLVISSSLGYINHWLTLNKVGECSFIIDERKIWIGNEEGN
jgi:hypothetical protein